MQWDLSQIHIFLNMTVLTVCAVSHFTVGFAPTETLIEKQAVGNNTQALQSKVNI